MTPTDNYQFDTSVSIVVQIYETLSSWRHFMEIKIIYNNNIKSIKSIIRHYNIALLA